MVLTVKSLCYPVISSYYYNFCCYGSNSQVSNMMKPIINDVNNIIRNVFRSQHPILGEIIVNWGKIVGVKFSKNSTPLKIISSKERGKRINILYISSDNSSASMEISYYQGIIIERIAIYLGYKAIHKIRFLVSG